MQTTTSKSREVQKVAREIRVLNRMWIRNLVPVSVYAREHARLVARLRELRTN